MYLRMYMFSLCICSLLDLARSSLSGLRPLLASLKVMCSSQVPGSFFFRNSPSPAPLPYSCHSLLQGSSQPRDRTCVLHTASRFFTVWAIGEALINKHMIIDSPVINKHLINRRQSNMFSVQFSSVQLLSHVRLFATPWTAACQASLSITNSWSLPKLMSIESVMPSSHLILCHPLLLLPSIFASIRVFSNESALRIRWPKYRSFSFNISPSNEYSGLNSFRMDWLDLLVVQGPLKSLL